MTSRRALLIDRTATLVVALMLVAAGALGVWWWSGQSSLPASADLAAVRDVVDTGWWPWASAAVGVLLILVGVRWITAHLGRPTVSRLHLRGSGTKGRLDVAGGKVAGAAADVLADTLGVRNAKGVVLRDRGQLVARLSAVIDSDCDLGAVARRADEVSAELRQVLDRDDLRCSVELRVVRFADRLPGGG
jgi:hypothetical protein